MVLRLSPDLPILWRTPTSVQFGSDAAVAVLCDVTDGEDRLIATLSAGISATGYSMLARSLEVSPEAADRLLAALAPALASDTVSPTARVAVLGESPLARAIAGLLGAAEVLGGAEDAGVIVLVADWVVGPADHGAWLNRDIPHLPVVTTERAVTVGPFVEPGVGPCLYCVQLARTDADPAWPAIATQLWGRPGRELDRIVMAETAAFVARRILARLADGAGDAVSWRIDERGEVTPTGWTRHPDCRCAVPAGIDWAAAPESARRGAPTTATVGVVPA